MSRLSGTAVILESEANPGTLTSASESQSILMDFNVLGSRKYRFALEIRLQGREPYRTEGIFKVPKRAENTGLLESGAIPAGIEVPVSVDPGRPDEVEIDWKAWRANPDRKRLQKSAKQDRHNDALKRQTEKNPKLQAKMQANNKVAVQNWVAAVNAGSMTREKFEETVDGEVATGRMDPADAEAARADLDS